MPSGQVPPAGAAGRSATGKAIGRRSSSCGVKKFADRSGHALHLRHVPGRHVRIGDIENVALKVSVSDELFNGFAIFHTSEAFEHAKDLVEPRASFSQDILEIGLEIAIVDERYQHPGIVVDQRRAEVVHSANSRLPIICLGLDLRYALAEQFCSAGANFADEGNLSL